MSFRNDSYLVVLLLLPNVLHSWRSYDIDLTGYRHEHDNHTIKYYNIELMSFKQRHVLTGSLMFARNIENFQIEVAIGITRPNSKVSQFNINIDGCQMLDSSSVGTAYLIKIIVNQFRKDSGYFPEECPVEGNRPISLQNFFVDPETFPLYMPEFKFVAHFNMLIDRKYIFKNFLNGSVYIKRKTGRKSTGRREKVL